MKRGNLVQLANNCGVLLTLKFIHKEFRYMKIIHELINSWIHEYHRQYVFEYCH
jgi:hypothetical protein